MLNIIKIKHCIAPVALGIITAFCATNEAQAAEVTVKNMDELWNTLENITEDTTITIDKNYDSDGQDSIYVYLDTDFNVTLDINHVNFVGESTVVDDGEGDFIIKNALIDGTDNNSDMEISVFRINSENSKGKLILKDSVFKNNNNLNDGAINISGSDGTFIEIDNILSENNKAKINAGVSIDETTTSVRIKNSTFNNNESNGGGAAINSEYGNKKLEVLNSKFVNNKTNLIAANSTEGAGAIYIEEGSEISETIIKDSIFENNKVIDNKVEGAPSAGAISSVRVKQGDSFILSGNTFSGNEGVGGGGALIINESEPAATNLVLENNTFYKNASTSNEYMLNSGGAFLINNATEDGGNDHFTNKLKSKNNTFIENKMIRDQNVTPIKDVQGGAIGMTGSFMAHEFKNDLLVGNGVENNQTPSKLFSNVHLSSKKFKQSNSLGFDNGTETKDTVEQAYGKYPVVLAENGSKVRAGRKEDATVVPTIMIAPKLTTAAKRQTTGFANMAGANATEKDQRGFTRKGKPDIGAVEISSIVYDSNGGDFALPELTKYDGKTYYEGVNADQYAKVGTPGSPFTIIDGKKVLKPTKKGYTFQGWSNVVKPHSVNPKYNVGKKVTVDDQIILYAVWRKDAVSLKYFNNGKTTGTIPIQKNIVPNATLTIKSAGKMKRKGYKFSGWSTKPTAKKGEAKYAPGKKLKMAKNINLYAIWKR